MWKWFNLKAGSYLLSATVAGMVVAAPLVVQSATQARPASCSVSDLWCVKGAEKSGPPQQAAPRTFVENELLLMYDSSRPGNFADQLLKKFHLQEKSSHELSSIKTSLLLASTNGQDPGQLKVAMNREQKAIEVNTNNLFDITTVDSARQPGTGNNTGYPLALTGIKAAHQYTRGGNIKIGMIDTPIDILHNSLKNAKVERVELVPAGDALNQKHGTEMAGVLISKNPRIGVAPEASLFAVSAFSRDPKQPNRRTSNARLVARALDLCIQEGVDVLNLSFAGGRDSLVDRMINKAVREGIIVVASAGNGGKNARPAYPAANPNVLAVTAVDDGEKIFDLANRGAYIDLSAPGVDILTTAPRGSFSMSSGTSLATAHVTGVIALLLSVNRNGFKPNLLGQTAIDLGARGRDDDYGFGLVNVSRAINILRR